MQKSGMSGFVGHSPEMYRVPLYPGIQWVRQSVGTSLQVPPGTGRNVPQMTWLLKRSSPQSEREISSKEMPKGKETEQLVNRIV